MDGSLAALDIRNEALTTGADLFRQIWAGRTDFFFVTCMWSLRVTAGRRRTCTWKRAVNSCPARDRWIQNGTPAIANELSKRFASERLFFCAPLACTIHLPPQTKLGDKSGTDLGDHVLSMCDYRRAKACRTRSRRHASPPGPILLAPLQSVRCVGVVCLCQNSRRHQPTLLEGSILFHKYASHSSWRPHTSSCIGRHP